MLSHEPCHAHTLSSIGQGYFGCFVYKYFWMFSFHIPLSRTCISPICGRRGWYARPRGVVVAGSLAGRVFFVAGGWPGGRTCRGVRRPAALGAGDLGGASVITKGKQHDKLRLSACPPHTTIICICTYISSINYMYPMWRIKYLICFDLPLSAFFNKLHHPYF